MSTSAALIILAIFVLMGVVLLVQRRARRPEKPASPQASFEEAWQHYLQAGSNASARDRRAVDGLQQGRIDSDAVEAATRRSLNEALQSAEPVAALRRSIMDATDRFVMIEGLQGRADTEVVAPDLSPEALQATVEAGTLRAYSKLRFADWAEEDWYTHYLRVAEMNVRNVGAMVEKTIHGELSSIETSLHEPLTRAMREAREALLHYPPQTPVDPTARLGSDESTMPRAPSAQQVERLTNVMSQRLGKLFAGQVYVSQADSELSPADGFQVDSALLHALLSTRFGKPTPAWRRILSEALEGHFDAIPDESKILEIAARAHQSWQRGGREGALQRALTTALEQVLDDVASEKVSVLTAELSADAERLSADVRRALETES